MKIMDLSVKDGFQLDTDTLIFMQEQSLLVHKLTPILGNYYIVSGCEVTGPNTSPGYVVIDGFLYYMEGGLTASEVVLVETVDNAPYFGTTPKPVYISRKVVFGSGVGAISWSLFKRADVKIKDIISSFNPSSSLVAGLAGCQVPSDIKEVCEYENTNWVIVNGGEVTESGRSYFSGTGEVTYSGTFSVAAGVCYKKTTDGQIHLYYISPNASVPAPTATTELIWVSNNTPSLNAHVWSFRGTISLVTHVIADALPSNFIGYYDYSKSRSLSRVVRYAYDWYDETQMMMYNSSGVFVNNFTNRYGMARFRRVGIVCSVQYYLDESEDGVITAYDYSSGGGPNPGLRRVVGIPDWAYPHSIYSTINMLDDVFMCLTNTYSGLRRYTSVRFKKDTTTSVAPWLRNGMISEARETPVVSTTTDGNYVMIERVNTNYTLI